MIHNPVPGAVGHVQWDVPGKIREVTDVSATSFKVTAQGGKIEVLRTKFEDGKNVNSGELAQSGGIAAESLPGG